jgi:3-oxoadipate enol-lactonase
MIDGSTLHLIDDAAHLSNIEQPAAFNGVLRTFIDGVEDVLMKSN